MPTDIPAMQAKLYEERAVVAEEVALIDYPAEQALIDAAQITLNQAQQVFDKKSERYALVMDKQQRLNALDRQIALFT